MKGKYSVNIFIHNVVGYATLHMLLIHYQLSSETMQVARKIKWNDVNDCIQWKRSFAIVAKLFNTVLLK